MIRTSLLWTMAGVSTLLIAGTSYGTFRYIKVNSLDQIPRTVRAIYDFDRCYPSTLHPPLRVSRFVDGNITYWEVEAQSLNPNDSRKALQHFRTEGTKCKWLNRNRSAFRLHYLPEPVAIAFAKMHYEPMLQTCVLYNKVQKDPHAFCIKDMETGLSGTLTSPALFFPEELKALAQMGLQVTHLKNVRLIARSPDSNSEAF